MQMHT